ncbi:hypothetical protein ACF0H5_019633 [Mactra antiquata]
MKIIVALVCVVSVTLVDAGQKCTGSPRRYNGKNCASTTNYADYHKGACGCGPDNNDNQFGWNHDHFVAAANQATFDRGGAGWCGQNCGKCVRLTTTGGFVDGQGGYVPEGQTHTFMITNLCPDEWPNLSWCSQNRNNGYRNSYGYEWHFDLEDGAGQVASIGWKGKNPEVTWEYVNCDGHEHLTPTNGLYHQCFCGRNGK